MLLKECMKIKLSNDVTRVCLPKAWLVRPRSFCFFRHGPVHWVAAADWGSSLRTCCSPAAIRGKATNQTTPLLCFPIITTIILLLLCFSRGISERKMLFCTLLEPLCRGHVPLPLVFLSLFLVRNISFWMCCPCVLVYWTFQLTWNLLSILLRSNGLNKRKMDPKQHTYVYLKKK